MRWPQSSRSLALAAVAGGLAAPVGWLVTDHLERDNDFCNACHLEPGVPLHLDVRRDFDADVPASLAGVHRAAGLRPAAERPFRCIDCHGGTGFGGRLRVKLLAARDAFWYVVGDFEEPDGMRWPLRDDDCARCHARFDESLPEPWRRPRFHQLPVHNVELGVACVECHLVHDEGGASPHFLDVQHTRAQCARCHPEFEEEAG